MKRDGRHPGLPLALLATGALGTALVAGSWVAGRPSMRDGDGSPVTATAEYGRRLLRETTVLLGPDAEDPAMRYTGGRLDCASCHLETGQKPGTLSLQRAASRYPRFSGRDGRTGDLKDRINGCMQRSMNGRPLPRDSVEMIAMERYILGLADQFAATAESRRAPTEPPAFAEPDRAADVEAGRIVYENRCQVCHGIDGAGLKATADPRDGYLFPPLWGPDSFNDGAGMHRVLTAARFIKARMPFGLADLTDAQAYDVAAFINSKPRPAMQGLDRDYPDRAMKPVDSPYPPYADPFPREQHRLGPFGPIRDYYEQLELAGD
jgi:thiosulfate dehydrogenase